MTLHQLGTHHQTDKATHHHYLGLYDLLFHRVRRRTVSVLEIGVQFGNSLRTWKDYFPFGTIIGIDTVDNGVEKEPGIDILIGNAYTHEMIGKLRNKQFDIIIDDGSHDSLDQVWFVGNYSPLLSRDGILIVEDVLMPATTGVLCKALPEKLDYVAVEMTEGASQVDSRLFIAWKRYD